MRNNRLAILEVYCCVMCRKVGQLGRLQEELQGCLDAPSRMAALHRRLTWILLSSKPDAEHYSKRLKRSCADLQEMLNRLPNVPELVSLDAKQLRKFVEETLYEGPQLRMTTLEKESVRLFYYVLWWKRGPRSRSLSISDVREALADETLDRFRRTELQNQIDFNRTRIRREFHDSPARVREEILDMMKACVPKLPCRDPHLYDIDGEPYDEAYNKPVLGPSTEPDMGRIAVYLPFQPEHPEHCQRFIDGSSSESDSPDTSSEADSTPSGSTSSNAASPDSTPSPVESLGSFSYASCTPCASCATPCPAAGSVPSAEERPVEPVPTLPGLEPYSDSCPALFPSDQLSPFPQGPLSQSSFSQNPLEPVSIASAGAFAPGSLETLGYRLPMPPAAWFPYSSPYIPLFSMPQSPLPQGPGVPIPTGWPVTQVPFSGIFSTTDNPIGMGAPAPAPDAPGSQFSYPPIQQTPSPFSVALCPFPPSSGVEPHEVGA